MQAKYFQQRLFAWFDEHGRKDLPWQHPVSPYRVWVSEIMLQQTQVATAQPYFLRFIQRFPDVAALAQAPVDDVLVLWAGLGYYARARHLHKAAIKIAETGEFPNTLEGLVALPGIGVSTAGAILSIAFAKSTPILDGNVRRVLARFKAIEGWTGRSDINKKLWEISAFYTPTQRSADYTQAIMDLGATLCTRSKPRCMDCPLQTACLAFIENKTQCLPTAKPRKSRLIKHCYFLLLSDESGAVLVEKRPPTGIWGGLWSVPEFSCEQAALDWCVIHKFYVKQQATLATKRHTFSHYHLDYTPILINTLNNNVMAPEKGLWYKHRQENTNIALPAPISKLFDELNEVKDGKIS